MQIFCDLRKVFIMGVTSICQPKAEPNPVQIIKNN